VLSRPQAPTIRLCQALATYRGPRVISTYRRAGRARLRVAPLDWRYLQNERFGSSYSAAAANMPAINKMNPRAYPPRFPQLRSDALENLCASHPCHAAVRRDVCRDPSCDYGRRAHKASRPDRGRSAICSPVPRRLEHDPRAANAACQIIRNSRTRARRTTDENSGEISRGRVDRYNLQHRAPLTLPNGGEQALRRRRSNGSEQKKQTGDGTVHIFPTVAVLCG